MQFPKRLVAIGKLVHEGAYIADIGADHGLLEQYIAYNLKDYHILAIENKDGPLSTLRSAVECLKNIIVSHSDGMNQVTSEYDTVVLAGMGGDNIVNILSKNPKKLESVKQVIVDAHSYIPKVRKAMIDFGFDIDYEELVYEGGIYYIIISFKRNKEQKTYKDEEIEFGYKLYLDPLYKDYKNYTLNKYKKLLSELKQNKVCRERRKEVKNEIRRFKSYGQN